ncbi:MAG: hypothetical protein OXC72_08020, partial [Roseovarius sp.]|nr:hypothetical protein [Roseovarius sp.]
DLIAPARRTLWSHFGPADTLKANLTVGPPFDYHLYEADSLVSGHAGRIEIDDPYFQKVSESWGDALKSALDSLENFKF